MNIKIIVKTVVLCAGILIPTVKLCAQSTAKVQGNIADSNGKYLRGATVSLVKNNEAVANTQTDTKGLYLFSNVKPGQYSINVSMIGFTEFKLASFDVADRNIILPDILLQPNSKQLQSVTVTAAKKLLEIMAGKTVFNVENSLVSSGSSAFDVLQKSPGVSVGQDDNLLLKGNANINVMIDGKMTYLSAQQLANVLRGMPAENLKQVEIMNIPSSQFDASGVAGVINIVTKKIRKKGYALNISAGAGGGRFGQTTESVLGNIANKYFNVYGGYTYNYKGSYMDRTSYRVIDNTVYDRASYDPTTSNNHAYKIGADFYLNKNNQLGFLYSGFNNTWQRVSAGPTQLLNLSGLLDSVVQNTNTTSEPSINNSFNVNYIVKIDSLGRSISFDGDYIRYNNNSFGTQGNQFFDKRNTPLQSFQQLLISQPSIVTIRSLKADMVLPFKNFKISTGARYAYVNTDNNFRYDSLINGQFILSKTLSNYFVYDEKVLAAYVSVTKDWKTFSLDAGLRAEHTNTTGNLLSSNIKNENNYTSLFPYIAIGKELSSNVKMDLAVSRRINRPVYGNLNPSRYYFDKYSYYEGNPQLSPEFAWNTALSFTWFNKYVATLNSSITNNPMLGFAVEDSLTGELRVTTLNFSSKYNADLLLAIPVKISTWWDIQNTIDISYNTYQLQQAKTFFTAEQWTVDISSTQSFRLPHNHALELSVHYTSPALDGVYATRRYFVTDAGWKKSFFNKKLDAVIAVSDIFKTYRIWGYSLFDGANVSYNHTLDSRRLNISFTYRFGGSLKAKSRQIQEQERL